MNKKTVKEINHLAALYRDYTAQNLSKLVQKKSLSCQEKDVAVELTAQMQEAGFDEVRTDGLGNVIGRIGDGPKVLALDAHIDTVDVGNLENWDFEPFCGTVTDTHVLGRGTVDQKGGAASFVTAGKIVKEMGLAKDLTLLCIGTVMEEDSDGLCWKYLVEEENIKPDVVISTEPTNLGVYRGQRGRMEMEVRFKGISSHGSAPERGKNAIYMAARAALGIEELNNHLAEDLFLGKGSITISEIVSGSPSLCAVADFAKLHLDRRLTWGESKDSALQEIRNIIETEKNADVQVPYYQVQAYTGLEYGMEKYYPTWRLDENHPAVSRGAQVFEQLCEKTARIDKWTFSTNGVTINGMYGIPVIGFGPGNEVLAHAPNEMTPISDLVTAAAFYAGYTAAMASE